MFRFNPLIARITATSLFATCFFTAIPLLHHVHTLGDLPLWSYPCFAMLLAVSWVCIWAIITGFLPRWNPPEQGSTRIRLFHPAVFFWESWKEINRESATETKDNGITEVIIVTVVVGFSLTLVEYFGDRHFLASHFPSAVEGKYGELTVFAWWSGSRVFCYVCIPAISILIAPQIKLRNCGLKFQGFAKHLWIYGTLFALVLPVLIFISFKQDFKNYYPFYDFASRSWFDFIAWEFLYAMQFLALEFLFRGYMLHPLKKSLGANAIFLMIIPYCMIHYGKPYLEANAAIVAGIILGTLSMKTGSIWCGCLIHITVAVSMDLLALAQKGQIADLLHSPLLP